MSYRIEGAQNFTMKAETAAEALTLAKAAQNKFPPIKIFGPEGEITLFELRARVEAEKRRS